MEVRTEIMCPEHWDGTPVCMMGPVRKGDRIHMSFTLSDYGRLEGMFEVVNKIHVYDDSTGYRQRVQLKAIE